MPTPLHEICDCSRYAEAAPYISISQGTFIDSYTVYEYGSNPIATLTNDCHAIFLFTEYGAKADRHPEQAENVSLERNNGEGHDPGLTARNPLQSPQVPLNGIEAEAACNVLSPVLSNWESGLEDIMLPAHSLRDMNEGLLLSSIVFFLTYPDCLRLKATIKKLQLNMVVFLYFSSWDGLLSS